MLSNLSSASITGWLHGCCVYHLFYNLTLGGFSETQQRVPRFSVGLACVAGVRRGREKGSSSAKREREREARSWVWVVGGNWESHDRASRSNSPSPFPFERRPRRLLLDANFTRAFLLALSLAEKTLNIWLLKMVCVVLLTNFIMRR